MITFQLAKTLNLHRALTLCFPFSFHSIHSRGTTKAIKAPAPTQAQSKNDGAGFSFYGRATVGF